jgi:hypothetical protein
LHVALSELRSLAAAAAAAGSRPLVETIGGGDSRNVDAPPPLAGLVNANSASARKIFEEESASTYSEPCLLVQSSLLRGLVAASARAAGSDAAGPVPDEPNRSLAVQLAGRCRSVLEELRGLYPPGPLKSSGAIAGTAPLYDVTAQAKIFPQLHSLLLACSVVCLLGWGPRREDLSGGSGLSEAAAALVERASASPCPLHALVREALEALARPDPERIRRACFLLAYSAPPPPPPPPLGERTIQPGKA